MTAQIVYLTLVFINLLLSANKHGKPKIGNESFWATLFATLTGMAILYWGGFFDGFIK